MATEARSLIVEATLEDNELRIGMDRIKQQLRETATEGDKANISFANLKDSVGGIASAFTTIGTLGIAALGGLATQGPAVADEMASIKNSMRELSFVAAETLEPVFQAVADDLLPNLVGALEDTGPAVSNVLANLSSGLGDILEGDKGTLLAAILGGGGTAAIAGILGAGTGGVALAGIAGAAGAANAVNTPTETDVMEQSYSPTIGIPGGPGIAFPAIGRWIEGIIRRFTDKDDVFFSSNTVPRSI